MYRCCWRHAGGNPYALRSPPANLGPFVAIGQETEAGADLGSDPNSPYTRELTVDQIVALIQAMPVADAVSFVKAHVTPTNFPTVSCGRGGKPLL